MQSKGVRRYRPGQAPKWAREEGGEEEEHARRLGKVAGPPAGDGRAWDAGGGKSGVSGGDEDRRLRRAAQRHKADAETEQTEDEEEALRQAARRRRQEAEVVFSASSSSAPGKEEGRRRRAAVAEVVAAPGSRPEGERAIPRPVEAVGEADEDDEEDSFVERRKRLKEKLREEEEEEEELARVNNNNEEDREGEGGDEEEEDSSEYESDTSDDEEEGYGSRRPVVAPTFVRKQDRETIRERERKEQEEAMQAQKDEELKERRKAQTRELLVETIQKERIDAQQHDADADGSSSESEADPEEEDEEAEFEKWKIRELKRIRRDQEEKMGWEKEQQELEKRRGMSDAEIAKLDAEALQPKEKKKWKFLQKYYHKGAFYQDEELVKETDFSEPTLEDRFDRTILPKVMQVKNFGRAGRTKWTHLVDQDTTYLGGGKTNPFARSGEGQSGASTSAPTTTTTTAAASSDRWDPWAVAPTLRSKYTQKMGGVGSVDDPLHRKRKRPAGQ